MKCFSLPESAQYVGEAVRVESTGAVTIRDLNYSALFHLPETVAKQQWWVQLLLESTKGGSHFVLIMTDWNSLSLDGGIVDFVEGFRIANGEGRSLSDAPGHCFAREEIHLMDAFLRLVIAFEWGAYFLSSDSTGIVFEIFDCFLRCRCEDNNTLLAITESLRDRGGTPIADNFLSGLGNKVGRS